MIKSKTYMKKGYFILIVMLFFVAGFAYAKYWTSHYAAHRLQPAMEEQDGEFYVRITKMDQQNRLLHLRHVKFFTAEAARASAQNEVRCAGKILTDCVPSLDRGYYVRESGAGEFIAPLHSTATLWLSSSKPNSVSVEDLNQEISWPGYNPVFKVTIKNKAVVLLEEITRFKETGYVLDGYKVEKILDASCKLDSECQTPPEYLVRSSCQYTAICEQNKCSVICPSVFAEPSL